MNFSYPELRLISYIHDVSMRLREELDKEDQKELMNSRQSLLNKKFNDYCKYIDSLFTQYNDLTFVSCIFSLEPEVESLFGSHIPVEGHESKLIKYREDFFNKRRSVQGLVDIVGYIGKWELSNNLLSFRVIFALPADQVDDSTTLMNQIAHYWEDEITHGAGICYSTMLAAKTSQLKRKTVRLSTEDSITSFKERVVTFIVKSEQYYMPVHLDDFLSGKYTGAKRHHSTFRGST